LFDRSMSIRAMAASRSRHGWSSGWDVLLEEDAVGLRLREPLGIPVFVNPSDIRSMTFCPTLSYSFSSTITGYVTRPMKLDVLRPLPRIHTRFIRGTLVGHGAFYVQVLERQVEVVPAFATAERTRGRSWSPSPSEVLEIEIASSADLPVIRSVTSRASAGHALEFRARFHSQLRSRLHGRGRLGGAPRPCPLKVRVAANSRAVPTMFSVMKTGT